MKFWDSSAIVPLLVEEPSSPFLIDLCGKDPVMFAWWGTDVECVSALARLERGGHLSLDAMAQAMSRLHTLRQGWNEIQPVEILKEMAIRMLRVHNLRVADSMQLAAALLASANRPAFLDFVCLDDRLAAAARREGFNVIGL